MRAFANGDAVYDEQNCLMRLPMIVQDIPLTFALPLPFLCIVYWMTALRPTATAFFETYFLVIFISLVGPIDSWHQLLLWTSRLPIAQPSMMVSAQLASSMLNMAG